MRGAPAGGAHRPTASHRLTGAAAAASVCRVALPGFLAGGQGQRADTVESARTIPLVLEAEWDPVEAAMSADMSAAYYEARAARSTGAKGGSMDEQNANWGNFFQGNLPGKVGTVLLLLALSRVGVYIPIDGVDRVAFAESLGQCVAPLPATEKSSSLPTAPL